MHKFTQTKVVKASPEKVWEIVADHAGMPKWFPGVRRVTLPDAPKTGKGTRRNVEPGGPVVLKEIITDFEPGKLLGYSVRGGIPLLKAHQGYIRLSPAGSGGTRIDYETRIQTALPLPGDPVGFAGGVIMNGLIGEALKKLKKLAER